jgi:methylmalonyl-CoA mutase C-terminal domain/subunit
MLVSKLGSEGDDRGAKLIARRLRDAGVEVVYTGPHANPEEVVAAAIDEDADAVALSILSGAHMDLVPRVLELLRAHGRANVRVAVGGTISSGDAARLERLGVKATLSSGGAVDELGTFMRCELGRSTPIPPT